VKTYDRAKYIAAQLAWDSGRFGRRWDRVRVLAAERGYIAPPLGGPDDDTNDSPVSQRAIIYAALEDRPAETEAIVKASTSWYDVVGAIISMRLRISLETADRDEADAQEKRSRDARDPHSRSGQGQGVCRTTARPVAIGDVLATSDVGSRQGSRDDGETSAQ